MKKKLVNKCICRIINVIFGMIVAIFLALVGLFAIGYQPFIVTSGSMEPAIHTGSLTFINTKYDYEDLQVGDVIAYDAGDEKYVTHRILSIQNGLLETKGDSNDVSDGFSTSEENFAGYTTSVSIPNVGYLISFLQTKKGIIVAVTLVVALLLVDVLLSEDDKIDAVIMESIKEKGESDANEV